MRVIFRNLETPGAPLDCTINITKRTKEGRPKGVTAHKLHLEHGHEYDLDEAVVKHLNSLTTPLYRIEEDLATHQVKHVRAGNQNRFWLQPIDLPGQIAVADQQAALAQQSQAGA